MTSSQRVLSGRRGPEAGARHSSLARKQVSDIQRARVLTAMVEVAGERGALDASVSHVVARSGISRRTFYELFEDREDCFLSALEDTIERARDAVAPAYELSGTWQARMRGGLTALLDFCEQEPRSARLLFVDSLGGGELALERRREIVQVVIDAVNLGRRHLPADGLPQLSAEGTVGAVLSVIHARLIEGKSGELLELVNPLMSMIVLPYLGRAAANRELEQVVIRERAPEPRSAGHPLRELRMRLTYRTICVLEAVEQWPNGSNRQIANGAGIVDQGQISKLLARLHGLGLVENRGADAEPGGPNAWVLTAKGQDLQSLIKQQVGEA